MVSLPELAERLQRAGLLQKAFLDCTRSEICQVIEAVFSSIGDEVPPQGWQRPRLEGETLIIPLEVHPDYRWWTKEGASVREILLEVQAPYHVAKKYAAGEGAFVLGLTEEEWARAVECPF